MGKFLSFLLMAILKILTHVFYKGKKSWLSQERESELDQVTLIVFLNHTSLYEPLFARFAPWRFLWDVAHKVVLPGADITMQRPFTGKVLKSLLPGMVPITRKKDDSWHAFLDHVNDQVITAILPEGRMKRPNGLDKHGNPMSVRGGVADILEHIHHGKVLFIYSGGLHHIQAPGEVLPRLFKTISANLELVDVEAYKALVNQRAESTFKGRVMADMDRRLLECVP